jgi:hypothetical protein
MGFFNIYKAKEYKPRYIYYDPKKEAKEERDRQREKETNLDDNAEYQPKIIKRGTFREMADKNKNLRREHAQKSNTRIIIILVILVAIAYLLIR